MAEPRIPTLLVAGGTGDQREAWILQDLQRSGIAKAALLLEGLPSGASPLDEFAHLNIRRSAPRCLCCTGNLVMRVSLNRLLRAKPPRLYIGVAPGTHVETLATMLTAPPYSDWLVIESVVSV